jgi:hypothetical protein
MADERRGERAGHQRRRVRGLAGVALLFALLIAGCDETAPVDPGQLPGGSNNSGSTGGGGATTDTTSLGDQALVGTWVNSRVPTNDQDVARIITTWVFAEDGTCARSIVTERVSSGPESVLRIGRCRAAGTEISVLFLRESVPFSMTYGLPNLATLTLDGLLFDAASST